MSTNISPYDSSSNCTHFSSNTVSISSNSLEPALGAALAALPPVGTSRISAIDRLFAKMPSLSIGGVFTFSSDVDLQTVKEHFGRPMLDFPRFRQKLQKDESKCWRWVEDSEFDIDGHFSEEYCEGEDPKTDLLKSIEQLKREGLDPAHPLWKVRLVHLGDGTSAMVLLIDHSVADGHRFLQALNYIFEEYHADEVQLSPERPRKNGAKKASHGTSLPSLTRAAAIVQQGVAGGFHTGAAVGRALGSGPQLASPIKQPKLVTGLNFDWIEDAFSLKEIKAIGRQLPAGHATVNDVMLAILSQALRRYFMSQGVSEEELEGYKISCGMPCSMRYDVRRKDGVPKLGNHVGGLSVDLDLGIDAPMDQLHKVRKTMKVCKGSFQSQLSNKALKMLSFLPDFVVERGYHQMTKRISVLVSNVPGPMRPWQLGDYEVSGVKCFLEGQSDLGLGLVVFSYAGQIQVSFLMDPEVIEDHELLKECFLDAYDSFKEILPESNLDEN